LIIFSAFEPLPDANMAIFFIYYQRLNVENLVNKPHVLFRLSINKLYIFTAKQINK
jgi:hypothetical protein